MKKGRGPQQKPYDRGPKSFTVEEWRKRRSVGGSVGTDKAIQQFATAPRREEVE